jgi:hypothetical protein
MRGVIVIGVAMRGVIAIGGEGGIEIERAESEEQSEQNKSGFSVYSEVPCMSLIPALQPGIERFRCEQNAFAASAHKDGEDILEGPV